jgi:D-alanine-D-alanine ligase
VLGKKDFYNQDFSKGFVLKPVNGGSSIDTVIAPMGVFRSLEAGRLFKVYEHLLYEEYIDGQEVTAAVLDGKALPLVLICPPAGKAFDYTNKYNGATKELCPVPRALISAKLQQKAQDIAVQVVKNLRVRHIARVDMIIRDDDIVTLEVNTIPGMTNQSLFPLAARASGIKAPELARKLVALAAIDTNIPQL